MYVDKHDTFFKNMKLNRIWIIIYHPKAQVLSAFKIKWCIIGQPLAFLETPIYECNYINMYH